MAKIKNVSGSDLEVAWLNYRLVQADQVVEVPAEDVYSYTQQTGTWRAADAEATELHDEGVGRHELVEAVEADAAAAEPPGNADRDTWATYVSAANLATEAELEGLNRNQIRDTYAADKREQ